MTFVLLSSVFLLKAQERSESIKWYSIEEAWKLNEEKPRLMFVDVFTNWCGWCKVMDRETFTNPEIISYMNKHFYCVKLNAERKDTVFLDGQTFVNENPGMSRSAHQIAIALLNGRMSYPSCVVMDEKKKVLTVLNGYQTSVNLEPVLHYFGEGAYQKQSWESFRPGFKGNVQKQ